MIAYFDSEMKTLSSNGTTDIKPEDWLDFRWLQPGVLAIALYDPLERDSVLSQVYPEMFADDRYRRIFIVMRDIMNAGNELRPDTVEAALRQRHINDGVMVNIHHHVIVGQPFHSSAVLRNFLRQATIHLVTKVHRTTIESLADPSYNPDDILKQQIDILQQLRPTPLESERAYTMAELYALQLPDPIWTIPSYLPAGLAVLAGRPKLGKSWMGLQIARAVATGGICLDEQVDRGQVLYIAMEDSERRIQERSAQMKIPADAQIDWRFTWPAFDAGGIDAIGGAIQFGSYRLVIVDTYNRLRGSIRHDDDAAIGRQWQALQRLALDAEITILIIDHHNKRARHSQDPIDDIMGTTEKSSPVDTVWGMYKKTGNVAASLKIVGRDVEHHDLKIKHDRLSGAWQLMEQEKSTSNLTEREQDIYDYIQANPGAALPDIAQETRQDKSNCQKRLMKLVDAGILARDEGDQPTYIAY